VPAPLRLATAHEVERASNKRIKLTRYRSVDLKSRGAQLMRNHVRQGTGGSRMGVWHITSGFLCLAVGLVLHLAQRPLREWSRRVYRGITPLFPNWSLRVPPDALLFFAVGIVVILWGIVELAAP